MAEGAGPAGIIMQATGQLVGGIEQNRADLAQARVDDANAQRTLLQGEQQVLQTRREERRQSGDMLASMGGSGILVGGGSAADVLAENAFQRELEILNIRSQTATDANNLYRKGGDARMAARSAIFDSIFNATSTAIGGAAKIQAQQSAMVAGDAVRADALGGGTYATAGSVPPMRVRGTM